MPREDKPHIARDRLYNDGGDDIALALHHGTNRLLVVIRHGDRIRRRARRHARRARHAERRHAGTGAHEQTVAVPMVAADELHDLIAPRISARKAQCAHRRLRPRVHHADDLDGGIDGLHELCKLRFKERRRTVTRTAPHRLPEGGDDLRMRMTDDHRPPRANVVDVFVAVDVIDFIALCARDKERVTPHICKGADGTVDPARHIHFCFVKCRLGLRRVPHDSPPHSFSHAAASSA